MERSRLAATAALLASAALLAGCSSSPEAPVAGAPTTSSSPSASPSTTPSSSPSSTRSAEKQQAADDAADAVRAYWQAYYDLLADPTPNLNDLNVVTVQPQLDRDLRSTQALLGTGKTVVTAAGQVAVVDPKVLKVNLSSKPPTVTLLVCVDTSTAAGTTDGKAWTGGRNEMKYRVVQTEHLPGTGWAVAEVLPPASDLSGSRPC